LPRSRLDVRVSAAPCGLSSSHRPRLLSKPVHSPASFASPSEHERPTTCPLFPQQPCDRREAKERLPGGSCPLRDVSWRRPLATEAPNLDLTLRPWRFARLRRLTPPPALRVCFTPLPRPGFALQGFVPHRGAFRRFPDELPSGPLKQIRLRLPAPANLPPSFRALTPHGECGGSRAAVKPLATPRPS
jgi:hypothetical protein